MTWVPVSGSLGWTGLPRLAIWLCVPALVAGLAGAVSQLSRVAMLATAPLTGAITHSTATIATLFGMLGMLLTPVAAILILTVSLMRRWRLAVIAVLWTVVIGSIAMTIPAIDSAASNWMVLKGVSHGQ